MAKNKKPRSGGKARHGHRHQNNQNNQQSSVRSSGAYSTPQDTQKSTFTLRDAVRNSAHPSSYFSTPSVNLRHQSMNFVRSNEPFEQESIAFQTEPSNPQNNQLQDIQHPEATSNINGNQAAPEIHQPATETQKDSNLTFASASPPSSDDDEVVFVGRNHLNGSQKQNVSVSPPSANNLSKDLKSELEPDDIPRAAPVEPTADVWEDVSDDDDVDISDLRPLAQGLAASSKKSRRRGRRGNSKRLAMSSLHDAMMEDLLDDYVANMRANGELPDEPEMDPAPIQQGAALKAISNGWTSDDIQDFDDMSTSHEILEAVQQILSKRERPSGLQYLVVWQDQSIDEARWISAASLTMPGAAGLIDAFEEEEKRIPEYKQDDSSSNESDELPIKWESDSADSELENELDDILDEQDLIERRVARMTDEHIARLLQKQESLGIFSDELQIFDADEEMELSDDDDDGEIHQKVQKGVSRKKRDQKRRKRQKQTAFDIEEDLLLGGDDYGDFDVMDFDRPSLQRGKHRQPDPLTNLSDSDMAQALRDSWAIDRKKKRAQKHEREELRAQGLLGKNRSKPDLKQKYKGGMSFEQLVDEIEDFICNGQRETLALPPMSKHERKAIHSVAQPFGLKSKSQGSGKQRFTILHKTARTDTLDFNDTDFSRLKRGLQHKFFPRMDQKGKGLFASDANQKSRTGYRDGEVVGATAPELGSGNRGRAMLEKMGWSSGTALGALDNQGILKPIEHVVKNSRAGLG